MAGEASKLNGKKGGRPKGALAKSTLQALSAKAKLVAMVEGEIEPLTMALIEKGRGGDVAAIRELFDRAFGKAPQAITGEDGGALKIMFDSVFKDASPR